MVALRRRPMAILRYLLERPRQLITKDELLDRLWADEHVSEGVLKTYFSEIRKALGDSAQSPRFIETAQINRTSYGAFSKKAVRYSRVHTGSEQLFTFGAPSAGPTCSKRA